MKSFALLPLIGLFALLATAADARRDTDCVNLDDGVPCKQFPDGSYPLCFSCDLGFFARCEGRELAAIKPCPHVQDENGDNFRLLFDAETKACVMESSTCPRPQRF